MDDFLTFAEIDRRYSKMAQEKAQPHTMMSALVRAFWRGEFEHKGDSAVFMRWRRDGDRLEKGNILKVGKDGKTYITAERRIVPIKRETMALLRKCKDYIPWSGDGSDDGLEAYAQKPYHEWPSRMRERQFCEWCIKWEDFERWYKKHSVWPEIKLPEFWPKPTSAVNRPNNESQNIPQEIVDFAKSYPGTLISLVTKAAAKPEWKQYRDKFLGMNGQPSRNTVWARKIQEIREAPWANKGGRRTGT